MFLSRMPSRRSGVETQVVCRGRAGRGLQRKTKKRRTVTEKQMCFLTPPPSTLHMWFKVLTATAIPSPPLTSIAMLLALPTPLPLLLLVTLRPRRHPPPFIISALLPPRCSIRSEPVQCQKAYLLCREMEACTNIRSPSQPSTAPTRTRECSSTTVCPIRDPSRSRTLFKDSGSNQPRSRLQEPVSPVPQPTPA